MNDIFWKNIRIKGKKVVSNANTIDMYSWSNHIFVHTTDISDNIIQLSIVLVNDFISDAYKGKYNLLELNSHILSTDMNGSISQEVYHFYK